MGQAFLPGKAARKVCPTDMKQVKTLEGILETEDLPVQ
jgi:hypothetical protein